uniref:SDR family NAD(P)-dependent oxidoreductase n=1 Tax=Limnohabitans sp. TaxID=1907725 RepID=UPI0037C0B200
MQISDHIAPQILQGRLALVTGGGQGNGQAIALGLAHAGARVIVTDLNEVNAQKVAQDILQQGGQAWAFRQDVTDEAANLALADRVLRDIGPIDILINNAGIIIREGIDSPNAVSNLALMLKVNVMGSFIPVHSWLPALRATKGCIINLAS